LPSWIGRCRGSACRFARICNELAPRRLRRALEGQESTRTQVPNSGGKAWASVPPTYPASQLTRKEGPRWCRINARADSINSVTPSGSMHNSFHAVFSRSALHRLVVNASWLHACRCWPSHTGRESNVVTPRGPGKGVRERLNSGQARMNRRPDETSSRRPALRHGVARADEK
jgi:hypothetical protein